MASWSHLCTRTDDGHVENIMPPPPILWAAGGTQFCKQNVWMANEDLFLPLWSLTSDSNILHVC